MIKLYSIKEYAKKKRITRQAVLKKIKQNKLKAIKIGEFWVVIEDSTAWKQPSV
jgi:predicted DNA-binding protein YlxM (UPF0122 family)